MARLPARDRVRTPAVARAILSPFAIALAGAGAVAALLGSLGAAAASAIFVTTWAAWVGAATLFAHARRSGGPRIDAGHLRQPWQALVRKALAAQRQFAAARMQVRPGPLRERLDDLEVRIRAGVNECWEVAQAGSELSKARHQIDLPDIERRIRGIDQVAAAVVGSPAAAAAEALGAQRDAVARMDAVISDTESRLRLLNAHLDESVTRGIELSVRGEADELRGLNDTVATVADDLESLRLGMDEIDRATELPSIGFEALVPPEAPVPPEALVPPGAPPANPPAPDPGPAKST